MHLGVRAKLLIPALILTACLAGLGLLSIASLSGAHDAAGELDEGSTNAIAAIATARATFNETRALVYNQTIQTMDAARAKVEDRIGANDTIIEEHLASFEATLATDAERAKAAGLRAAIDAYRAVRTGILGLSSAGKLDEAYAMISDKGVPAATAVATAFEDIVTGELADAAEAAASIESSFESSRLIVIIATLIAGALGLGISLVLSSRIVKGVTDVQRTLGSLSDRCATVLAEGMERLRDNDLTYAISPATPPIELYGTDEIGRTAEYTNALRDKVVVAAEPAHGRRRARDCPERVVVEMGESRTPRPEPFAWIHYERVRCFSSAGRPPIGRLPSGPSTCP